MYANGRANANEDEKATTTTHLVPVSFYSIRGCICSKHTTIYSPTISLQLVARLIASIASLHISVHVLGRCFVCFSALATNTNAPIYAAYYGVARTYTRIPLISAYLSDECSVLCFYVFRPVYIYLKHFVHSIGSKMP